jgi:hypothetical protein
VVETIRLESGHTLTGIVGSNPTLSAISFCGDLAIGFGPWLGLRFDDWGYLIA